MTEREENCKTLAEWLEQKPDYTPGKSSHSKMRAWVYVWGLPYPGDGGWKPADFYTDETANGMIRDRLLLDIGVVDLFACLRSAYLDLGNVMIDGGVRWRSAVIAVAINHVEAFL